MTENGILNFSLQQIQLTCSDKSFYSSSYSEFQLVKPSYLGSIGESAADSKNNIYLAS